MALAVLVSALMYLLIPAQFRVAEAFHYLYPAFLLLLLAILVIGDPGRIDREKRWLRVTAGVMIGVIALGTTVTVYRLVSGILEGASFGGADAVLLTGAVVWASTVIAFALWYWHLDSGGPAARANGTSTVLPAFRFPEHDLDDPRYADWYPQFVDYLALAFNTGTAFSPTDVSAVRHWSKLWLMAQSGLSLALIGLVIALAVNEL
jgi:hypothetical protein